MTAVIFGCSHMKVNYSQLLNSDLLPLLVHLAGQPTKLSKRWLLKDLEVGHLTCSSYKC